MESHGGFFFSLLLTAPVRSPSQVGEVEEVEKWKQNLRQYPLVNYRKTIGKPWKNGKIIGKTIGKP